jgi:anti-sigma B factor antagonist
MTSQLKHPLVKGDTTRDVTVVHFTGRNVSLNEETIHYMHDALFALADEPSESDLLLDFGNVDCLTSLALGALVSLHKKLLARGRHLTIDNMKPRVHEVFAVTKLDRFLDLRPARQEVAPTAEDGPFGSLGRWQERWIETPGKESE